MPDDRPRLPHRRRPAAGDRRCSTCWSTGSRTTRPPCSAARPADVAATVVAALDRGLGAGWAPADVVVAPGVPAGLAAGRRAPRTTAGPPSRSPTSPPTVTGVAVAIAETGTLVLDGSPLSGRRALSLLPDCLVCVVDAPTRSSAACPRAWPGLDPTAPLTMISGPSATSDIELQRVEGVHGPRTLVVVLVTVRVDSPRRFARGAGRGGPPLLGR